MRRSKGLTNGRQARLRKRRSVGGGGSEMEGEETVWQRVGEERQTVRRQLEVGTLEEGCREATWPLETRAR